MRKLVRYLQRVPGALGDGIKRPLEIEEAPIRKMGKKLVAARELYEGHVLAAEDVAIKSPADGGLAPYELDRIVGLRLRKRLAPDENLELTDLEAVEEPVAAHAAPRP
jgi:sialic acid synthase